MTVPFFARRFVAGVELDDAVNAVTDLNKTNIDTSLDILGENVTSEEKARESELAYEKVVDGIRNRNLRSHISIKLTMLGLDISTNLAENLLRKLVGHAKEAGDIFVRIDMEGSDYTARTIDLFLKVRKDYENLGVVLQAMLHRTKEDLDRIIEANGRIRLCKGAYKEPKDIAFQNMNDIRANYLKLAQLLFDKGNYPAWASHDDKLITALKHMSTGVDKNSFEFQMLYGLRRKTWHRLVSAGYNMRVYIPFGSHWYPYFSRRLRERKENIFFIMKNWFKG